MYRIDTDTAAVSPDAIPGAGTEKYWTGGNPGLGIPPTNLTPWWFNMVQEELRNVVVDAGITPDKTVWTQLASALAAHYVLTACAGVADDETLTNVTGALSGATRRYEQDGGGSAGTLDWSRVCNVEGWESGAVAKRLDAVGWVGALDLLNGSEDMVVQVTHYPIAGGSTVVATKTYTSADGALAHGLHEITLSSNPTFSKGDLIKFAFSNAANPWALSSARGINIGAIGYRLAPA